MELRKENILFEDKDILVYHKPAGIATQTARLGEQDVVSQVKNYLKNSYLGLVHRLDQPVEGILVFAKTKEAAAQLGSQNMEKMYYAVVCSGEAQEGILVDYLLKDGRENSSRVVASGTKDAKRAELSYRIIKVIDENGLAQIRLKTGRHHQIRVQMAHAGMPLLGDTKYGSEHSKEVSRKMNVKDVALCAYRLAFTHPTTRKKIEFVMEPEANIFKKWL